MLKIAIIGTAPSSRLIAPYADESYEIWACSAGNSQAAALPRVTRWFELHAINDMVGQENRGWSLTYYEWLKKQTFPIYMQEKNDLIPQAIVFPYKMLCERFGPNPKKGLTNWFTSSIAWMMAYAITMMKEGDELAIFGVDMAALEEAYTAQKAGLHRFVEYANAAGIKVTIPLESCLGQSLPLYGYAEATIIGRKLQWRLHEMTTIRGNLITECRQKELQAAFFEGAIEGCKYDLRTWPSGLEAELDTNGKEYGDAFVSELKSKSEQFGKQTDTADRRLRGERTGRVRAAGIGRCAACGTSARFDYHRSRGRQEGLRHVGGTRSHGCRFARANSRTESKAQAKRRRRGSGRVGNGAAHN